jgi:putative membrane protein
MHGFLHSRRTRVASIVLCIALVALGCDEGGTPESLSENANSELSDPQISQVLMSAKDGEVERGETAARKTTRTVIKDFAQQMVKDHTVVRQSLQNVLNDRGVILTSSAVSTDIEARATETLDKLRNRAGADFDDTYIDSQVKMHRDVLSLIDNKLLPQVDDTQLRSEIKATRAVVAHHLQKAQSIQGTAQAQGRQQPLLAD